MTFVMLDIDLIKDYSLVNRLRNRLRNRLTKLFLIFIKKVAAWQPSKK
jgi:hypothetical protein